jgi:hypothetical protein
MNVYSRLFKLLCYDMGSQCETDFSYQHLLEVLWQGSDDNVLTENGVAIFFFVCNRNAISQLFLRCSLVTAAGSLADSSNTL